MIRKYITRFLKQIIAEVLKEELERILKEDRTIKIKNRLVQPTRFKEKRIEENRRV